MKHRSLAAMYLSQAKRYGDRALYRYHRDGTWRTMSWREALGRSRDIAAGLAASGIGKGDRVAIFSANRVEWCLIDWANICHGALTVPIYASSTSAQAGHIIGHSEAAALFVDSTDKLNKLEGCFSSLRLIVVIDGPRPAERPANLPRLISLSELEQIGRERHRDEGNFEEEIKSLGPEDDLTVIYTSGTTGEPKGVLTTHGNYLFMLEAAAAAIPCGENDVNMLFLPLAHSLGRLEHLFVVSQALTCGVARSLETLAKDLPEIRPTLLISVPRIYENAYARIRARVEAGSAFRRSLFRWSVAIGARSSRYQSEGRRPPAMLRAVHRLSSRFVLSRIRGAFGGRLRFAISGGAPLSEDIARFFHSVGILILQGYGLTESSTVSHVNRPWHYKFGTVGPPLPGVECRTAEDGEILLRGPNIMKCYLRDPQSTREAVDEEGWLHTGDVGTIDEESFLTITDRKKDLIVTSGGKKIAPQMIENLLKEEPLIDEAIVLGDGERHLIALVTLDRERLKEWADKENLVIDGIEKASENPRVTTAIKDRIRAVNRRVAAYEAVRNFRILPHGFSMEKAEVTPTLKLRRRIIEQRYRALIEEMARRTHVDAN